MPLNWKQFLKLVEEDKKKGGRPCGCGRNCGKTLEPRVDGERPTINGKEVNSDCYYAALDKEIDEHPIGVGRRLRP